ncbi:MAG: hypothetical protein HOP10_14005 [Chitinophagaceae bacterium]|nr:hypothetical protein [Chitinophagaceae bacterium]
MKSMSRVLLIAICTILVCVNSYAQNINSESIEIQLLQQPKTILPEQSRNYKITVTSPYNLTKEDITRQAKADHQKALDNYDKIVAESEKEYQKKLKEHAEEEKKAKEKYDIEIAEFKKRTLLERLAMTEQGKDPKLTIPAKPEYYKPSPPVYMEPNLNDYIIVDNGVLASQVVITGLQRGGNYLDVNIDIKAANFQDNAGQTYVNQPVRIIVKAEAVEKSNASFFNDFEFVSSSPTNNINRPLEEKKYLSKVMSFINKYLNEMYGYQPVKRTVKILSVKNKGSYDDLEKANIYVTTNLKKLQADPDPDVNTIAFTNMQKGIDIWLQTLQKIEYKNSKADFNSKIAKFIFFNLMRINLALDKKTEAEKYLNQLQENLVDISLNNEEERELNELEKLIYKKNK